MNSKPINHVGINVPDIQAAFAWYRDVLGCYPLVPPAEVRNDGSHFGNVVADIFGTRFESVQMAHLTTADGIGIELFQFGVPATYVPDNTYEYWRSGIFHICLTAPDITGVTEAIVQSGGKQLSKIWQLYSNKEYKAVYCQDPWGTVIELCSHPYSQFWANLPAPEPM